MSTSTTADAELIKKEIERRVHAIREKDADAVLRGYAADVLTFDLVEPLCNRGVAAVRTRLTEWLGSFATPIDYAISGVELSVAGDVAFDSHFVHVRGTGKNGNAIAMWFRESVGWRKIEGEWKVVQQHSSVPLEMKSMKGRLDLEPPRAP